MITDFPRPKANNLAGCLSFKFTSAANAAAFPQIKNSKLLSAVQLKAGTKWLAGYATAYTLNFKEVAADSANGKYYTQTIEGFYPGDSPEAADLFSLMDGNYFMVEITDPQRRERLAGGYRFPLLFTSSYDSGSSRSDSRGYQFTFSGMSEIKAPFIK